MFSWDNKYAGVQILLTKVLLDGDGRAYTDTLKQYKAKADLFVCAYLQKTNGDDVPMTPGGLVFLLASNNLLVTVYLTYVLAFVLPLDDSHDFCVGVKICVCIWFMYGSVHVS